MPSDSRPPETHELKKGETSIIYCADFSNEPAVTAGATLSSCEIYEVENSRVTAASPQINSSAAFIQYDEDGTTALHTVPQSKGVKFAATGVSKGRCKVSIRATLSDGQKPIVDVIFDVK